MSSDQQQQEPRPPPAAASSSGTAPAGPVTVVAYYKFVALPDYRERREPLQACCERNGVRGMLLLAPEGINSTMAGPAVGVARVLSFLQEDPAVGPLEVKTSYAAANPFQRLKVRLKKEICTLGAPEVELLAPVPTLSVLAAASAESSAGGPVCAPATVPATALPVGEYVAPEKWNALISDPDVVVVDTRNEHEVELGSFAGALDPHTKSFREFPAFAARALAQDKDRPVAMFCTGGIRCEKATALLLRRGFKKVFHLQGGVLNYLQRVPPERSLWRGDCFVFDQRVAVDHHLRPTAGVYTTCHACRHVLRPADRADPERYAEGISCPHCFGTLSADKRRRVAERQRQVEIHRRLQRPHLGVSAAEVAAFRVLKQDARTRSRTSTSGTSCGANATMGDDDDRPRGQTAGAGAGAGHQDRDGREGGGGDTRKKPLKDNGVCAAGGGGMEEEAEGQEDDAGGGGVEADGGAEQVRE